MKPVWKKILDIIEPYKPGKPIEEVKRELGLEAVIKLASNENPKRPSNEVIEAIVRSAGTVNRYPDGGCFYLREALSRKLNVPGANIVFGNGSDEVILLALHAFVDPGDEVIVADPTFLIYHIASMIKGAKVKAVPLKDFRYDLESMAKAVTNRTKVIFIANPDNPTGTYITKDVFASFIDKVPKNVLIFMDEAYYEYAKGDDYVESLDWWREGRSNLIIARTFSKAYALAGLRVGYGISSTEIATVLDKVREPFNVNSIAQAAALAALENDGYVKDSVQLVTNEKKRFYQIFDDLGLDYIPSKTNFVLFNTKRDSAKVFEFLLKKGVIVREMSAWRLDGFIRANIGLESENDKFFEALTEAVKAYPEK